MEGRCGSRGARSSAWCGPGGTRSRWGEGDPPGKSGTHAETARASEPPEWRHRSRSSWPCFLLHANPGTTGTAIPACVPGAPHYVWGRVRESRRATPGGDPPRPGRAAARVRGVRAVVVVHTTHSRPLLRKSGRGKTRTISGGLRRLVGVRGSAVEKPSAPRFRQGWTRAWRGWSHASPSGARYSSVGRKGHKLGPVPEHLGTPDFGVLTPPVI